MRILLCVALLFSLWTTGHAAPISVDIDRNVNLAVGSRSFGPVALPNDVSICTLSFDRTNWTNAASEIVVTLFVSVDNGPMEFWLQITAKGEAGDGQTTMTRVLPAGINRQIRGDYVLSGARFRSTVSFACS